MTKILLLILLLFSYLSLAAIVLTPPTFDTASLDNATPDTLLQNVTESPPDNTTQDGLPSNMTEGDYFTGLVVPPEEIIGERGDKKVASSGRLEREERGRGYAYGLKRELPRLPRRKGPLRRRLQRDRARDVILVSEWEKDSGLTNQYQENRRLRRPGKVRVQFTAYVFLSEGTPLDHEAKLVVQFNKQISILNLKGGVLPAKVSFWGRKGSNSLSITLQTAPGRKVQTTLLALKVTNKPK